MSAFFSAKPLPQSARVRVFVDGSGFVDDLGRQLDADGDGLPGGIRVFDFDTLTLTVLDNTAVCGRIFASQLEQAAEGDEQVNCPLPNVKITVDGREEELFTYTDQFGNFRLEPAPVGRFFVHIDGRTSTASIPEGAYYPLVGKAWESTAGRETKLESIYLPLIPPDTLQEVSATEETVLTFADEFLEDFPEFDKLEVTIPPDSLYRDDGTRGGKIGVAPVPPDRLPGPSPAEIGFMGDIVTIQTDGATNFDEPVAVCFPNLPDPETGLVPEPGAKRALWSFNHDTGRFEVVGSMTVSDDGETVCSDPGSGILAPGWHCVADGCPGGGGPPGPGPGPKRKRTPPPFCTTGQENSDAKSSGGGGGAGDPVYLATGEFVHSETDLMIKGRGIDFVWTRSYASQEGVLTPMGHNWDFNYNIRIQKSGRVMKLQHGAANQELLYENAEGEFERREFDLVLAENEDATFTMTYSDGNRFHFHPCDGTPMDGRIAAIEDRNGNTLRFGYDEIGRLRTVVDTLDREISVSYTAAGFIQSVTDFTGRSVRYEYFGADEDGGGEGDLKAAISPEVVDTPHGNDFPDGKRRSYTYSKGFADDRLNHNLLTITDGRRNDPNDPTFGEGPYLENVYASIRDEMDINFDRVVRQTWGGDILDFAYYELGPEDRLGGEMIKTILNDRNGNVSEHFFDVGSRRLRERILTGRADPRSPTTETANRPTEKLRDSDPEFYETRWEYNIDSQVTREIHPNGNITEYIYERDLNPNGDPRFAQNLLMKRYLPGTHTPVGDQEMIVEEFEYLGDFGCNSCGFDFVSRHTDGRGNVTRYEYDDFGNRTKKIHRIESIVETWEYNEFGQKTAHVHPDNGSGHRRRDEYTYYEDGDQKGYQKDEIIDKGGFELTTTLEYDPLGRVVRRVDRRRNDRLYTYNDLDQLVQELSREVEPESGLRYEKLIWYDANNNVVREDTQNVNDAGEVVAENPYFSTTHDYEMLDHRVRTTQEVDVDHSIATEYEYDAKRNKTLVRYGEAATGRQPANTLARVYDERDLVFREIRAKGHDEQSTTQFDYDRNKNLVRRSDGIEVIAQVYGYVFDGYDRLVSERDPMGNVKSLNYDENHNLVRSRVDGELVDVEGDENNVRLQEVSYHYDEVDRRTVQAEAFFDTDTGDPILDGLATARTVYSDDSRVTRTINDNDHAKDYSYDTANRVSVVTDAKGNEVKHTYDANSNIVAIRDKEMSDLGNTDQEFTTTFEYDGLNRLITTIDNIWNKNRSFYDSRSNKTSTVDANGNRIQYLYDGLNRLLAIDRFMTDNGEETGAVVDHIITRQYWDDSSRLVGQEDDNGNLTTYVYDGLGRKVADVFADTTRWEYMYDVHGNQIRRTDASGSVVDAQFDLNDRVVRNDIAVGEGVSDDTTFENFAYDGLNRLIRAEDDDSLVVRKYDSLSHVTADIQNGQIVVCACDGVGNELELRYPNGRVLSTSYDEVERCSEISDSVDGFVASYSYIGPRRVERRKHGNGTRCDYTYDGITGVANSLGDFGVRRVVRTRHTVISNGNVLDDHRYTWDKIGNKTHRSDVRLGGPRLAHDYTYDSAYRLKQSEKSDHVMTLDTVDYSLDGVGNRTVVNGGDSSGLYTLNDTLLDPADFQVNQYTSAPVGPLNYDQNGNLIRMPVEVGVARDLTYDFENRLVEVVDNDGSLGAEYRYDVLGRRIFKRVIDGEGSQDVGFIYRDMQVIEEIGANGQPAVSYVYGNYIDEPIRIAVGNASYYYHQDELYNVRVLTDEAASPVARYEYSDYGRVVESFEDSEVSGNPYLFTGRRLDRLSGLYYYRARYYEPGLGRFISRDPMGQWGDPRARGNGFSYVGNNPVTKRDPSGQCVLKWICWLGGKGIKNPIGGDVLGLVCDWICEDREPCGRPGKLRTVKTFEVVKTCYDCNRRPKHDYQIYEETQKCLRWFGWDTIWRKKKGQEINCD